MSIEDLKKAFERINANVEKGRFSGPKTDELINLAEEKLDVKFPPTYKEFLKNFGAGMIFGEEIYGITSSDFTNSGIPDGIWLTLREREDIQLPKKLVLIYDHGDGVYFAIDTSKISAEEESPVVAWVSGIPDREIKIIFQDFGEFLRNILLEASKEEN